MQNIVITGLCKSYGDKTVLKDFSVTLPGDRAVALMGRSGAGKTTLARLLLGLESKDAGHIEGLPAFIAAVFQEDRLIESATAEGNLRFALGNLPQKKVLDGLTRLDLGDSLSIPVAEFSGGMRRRVAILRAVYSRAPYLILDEPFKGLDEETRRVTAAFIRENLEGRGMLLITHDEAEAALLGASVLYLPS